MKLETIICGITDKVSIAHQYSHQPTVLLWNTIFGWLQFWQPKKNRIRILVTLFSELVYFSQAALYNIHFQFLKAGCKGVWTAHAEMKADFSAYGNYFFFYPWVKSFWNVKYFKFFRNLTEVIKTFKLIGNFEREF